MNLRAKTIWIIHFICFVFFILIDRWLRSLFLRLFVVVDNTIFGLSWTLIYSSAKRGRWPLAAAGFFVLRVCQSVCADAYAYKYLCIYIYSIKFWMILLRVSLLLFLLKIYETFISFVIYPHIHYLRFDYLLVKAFDRLRSQSRGHDWLSTLSSACTRCAITQRVCMLNNNKAWGSSQDEWQSIKKN